MQWEQWQQHHHHQANVDVDVDVVPTNVSTILEYRLNEDFEGQSAWALGLDRTRAFAVTTLTAPPRLIVDITKG